MTNLTTDFIEKINDSYTFSTPSICLGAGILDGQVHAAAAVNIPLRMINRHGLVAGATGTGKTRTLQLLAEQLSDAGVPVFMLDVKGDLSGLHKPGTTNPRILERAALLQKDFVPAGFPVELYSLSGNLGAPMRATVTEFGPLLLGKLLDLNDTQTGVLSVIFKYADDNGLPVVDLKDLRKLVSYLADGPGAAEIKESYGRISASTSGTILRKIAAIEQQGLSELFGETSFDIADLLQRVDGKGVISLLNIADVQHQPMLYSTFLLSLIVEIYNTLPEAGDLDKPKLVFFFDEAHLLFKDASDAFMEQIETVIRLIRSKGVGIFFCTQAPADVPQQVLSQLGNRIQHALRAFTPNGLDALKKTVKTYPRSAFYKIDELLTGLGTGQALITVLNDKGIPTEVAATMLMPPRAEMAPLTQAETLALVSASGTGARYRQAVDSRSAYEMLIERLNSAGNGKEHTEPTGNSKQPPNGQNRRSAEKSLMEQVLGAPITRQIGKEIVRGLFGMLTGRKTRHRSGGLFGV
ncbi:ATPase [Pedobacter yulinensis]|uniref:ATPase n=1 Tax=Pedobacter yulinensis TaxID=2126353 RepID=A0A2T3HGN4_9SPHI|nr:helicase HerA-like domain-containing protein [Pedobacter yulinensis]PST81604.1 ATPase [Pedobacter yulinensis]